MTEGVDYSYARPNLAELGKAIPGGFVMRYIAGRPGSGGKSTDPGEVAQLHAAGLSVGLVWETSGGFMLGGAVQGHADAPSVLAWITFLNLPLGVRIHFALDQQPDQTALTSSLAYLTAMASHVGWDRVGGYGSDVAVDYWAAHTPAAAHVWWQTYAWSGGRISSHASILQYQNGVSMAGGTVDRCRLLVSPDLAGLWPAHSTPGGDPPVTPAEIAQVAAQASDQVIQKLATAGVITEGGKPVSYRDFLVEIRNLAAAAASSAANAAKSADAALAAVKAAQPGNVPAGTYPVTGNITLGGKV